METDSETLERDRGENRAEHAKFFTSVENEFDPIGPQEYSLPFCSIHLCPIYMSPSLILIMWALVRWNGPMTLSTTCPIWLLWGFSAPLLLSNTFCLQSRCYHLITTSMVLLCSKFSGPHLRPLCPGGVSAFRWPPLSSEHVQIILSSFSVSLPTRIPSPQSHSVHRIHPNLLSVLPTTSVLPFTSGLLMGHTVDSLKAEVINFLFLLPFLIPTAFASPPVTVILD